MKKAFSLVELIVVIGVLSTLLAFGAANIIRPQQRVSLTDSVTLLVSDIRSQQSKAMMGDTENSGAASSYGIYISSGSYTMFRGAAYDPGNSANQVTNLDDGVVFSTVNLPSGSIVFSPGTGEVSGYQPGSNSFSLSLSDGSASVHFFVNKYGVLSY